MDKARKQKTHILIVEDTEENIDILLETLSDEFSVSVALDGAMALKLVERQQPDLILLDIQMPVMDGYETCRRLKLMPETASIPVMFLTALTEEGDESKGLLMGAVDYITKPFNPFLVKARVRNQVELKKHKDHLESMVLERTRSLHEAHEKLRLFDATRESFLGAISHELRTPANSVLGVAQLALDYVADEKIKNDLTILFNMGQQRLVDTIDNALLLAEIQSTDEHMLLDRLDLLPLVKKECEKMEQQLWEKKLTIDNHLRGDLSVMGNEKLLSLVIATSVKVAMVMADQGTTISIFQRETGGLRGFAIEAVGKQFTEELLKTVFDPFSYERASSYISELGLAPPLAGKVSALLGGGMKFENTGSKSLRIEVQLLAP